jgi:AcrR family transcriptional regulator
MRRYEMVQRAASAEATGRRIVQAALQLFMSMPYDDVHLERIAADAGVSLKTVLRRFESKEKLVLACAHEASATEERIRAVEPGDLDAVVRILADRYEDMMEMNQRVLAVEDRVPEVATLVTMSRRSHWDWLAAAFAPQLPDRRDPRWRRRVAELFGATELYTWHSLRRRLGLSRKLAEEAMRETLEALVSRWREGGKHG